MSGVWVLAVTERPENKRYRWWRALWPGQLWSMCNCRWCRSQLARIINDSLVAATAS